MIYYFLGFQLTKRAKKIVIIIPADAVISLKKLTDLKHLSMLATYLRQHIEY